MRGAEFARLRLGAGITRAAVARGVGVSWETVRRWELGLRRGDGGSAGGVGSEVVEWLIGEIERSGDAEVVGGDVRGICNTGSGSGGGDKGG